MKRLLLFAMAIIFAMQLSAQTAVVVGDTNSSSTSSYMPAACYYKNSIAQSIYPAESLTTGLITHLSYYHNNSAFNSGTLKIYMKEVSESTLSSFDVSEGFVEVYSGPVNFPNGRCDFQLTTPFPYTGVGNLLITVIRDGNDYSNGHYFKTTSGSSRYDYSDDEEYFINQTPSSSSGSSAVPVIRLEISPLEGFCFPVTNVAATEIDETSATITWSVSDESASTFGIAYKKLTEEEWTIPNENITDFSYTLTGLDSYTKYQFKVWTICDENTSSESMGQFLTLPSADDFLELPYSENFDELEDLASWELWTVDNIGVNKWYLGSLGSNPNTEESVNGLYVSDDNGASVSYSHNASVAYVYSLINIEEDNYYGIEFDFKQRGENAWDEISVALFPIDMDMPTTNDDLRTSSYLVGRTRTIENEWKRYSLALPINITPGAYKLALTWRNDGGGGEDPAGTLDNLYIFSTSCAQVNDFVVEFEDAGGTVNMNVTVNDTLNDGAEYLLEYRYEGDTTWYTSQSESPITIADLPYASKVDYKVTSICDGSEYGITSSTQTVWTICSAFVEFPYLEDFDETVVLAAQDTTKGNNPALNCWYNLHAGAGYYYWSSISTEQGVEESDALRFYGDSYSYSYDSDYDEWLITPMFELTGNERLNFEFKPTSASNSPVIDILILDASENDYNTKADTANFTYISSISMQGMASNQFHMAEVLLNEYSGNVRLAFAVRQRSSSFYIDNVKISEIPACPDVYGLTAVPGSGVVYVTYNTDNVGSDGVTLAYAEVSEGEEFDPTSATTITISADEPLPYIIEEMEEGVTYAFAAQQACGGNWTETVTVTIPVAYSAPFVMDFDTPETTPNMEFDIAGTNGWFIGTAENNTLDETGNPTVGGGALYVSEDNGLTAGYNNGSSTNGYASMLLSIQPGQETHLSFDYKVDGEGSWDNMSVYLVPFGQTVSDDYLILEEISEQYTWTTADITLESDLFGLYNLVFRWNNDNMFGESPAAIIDNIKMTQTSCISTATEWTVSSVETADSEMSLVFNVIDEVNEGATYTIAYKTSEESLYTEVTDLTIDDFPYTITEGITHQTTYNVKVSLLCAGEELAIELGNRTLSTPCASLPTPWFEDFSTNPYNTPCWERYSGLMPASGIALTSDLTPTTGMYAWSHAINFQCGSTTSNMIRAELYGYSGYIYWAMTPIINLGNDGTAKQIAFDLGLRDYSYNIAPGSASDDRVMILVSLDNGATWEMTNGLVFADGDADTEHNYSDLGAQMQRYAYKLVDANGEPLTGTVRFAFYSESTQANADNFVCIDNIAVEDWAECPAPYNLAISNESITTTSATATFQTWGPATSWEYAIAEGTDADLDSQEAIALSTTEPVELTELTPETAYTFGVRSVCDENSEWTTITFTTLASATEVPYETTFDGDVWFVNNGSALTNAWTIGEGTGNQAPAAYISNDGETYAATLVESSTISHLWKDFNFGETEDNFELSFDWKVAAAYNDEGTITGGIAVYLVDVEPLPETGLLNSANLISVVTGSDEWQTERVYLGNVTGEKRLVITALGYKTDAELITPAAIDNVALTVSECDMIEDVAAFNVETSSIDVSWTETGADSYIVTYYEYGVADAEEMTVIVAESPATISNLESSTSYVISVIGVCAGNESVPSTPILATTLQESVELPYTCDFEEEGSNGWLLKNGNLVNKWYVGTPTGETSSKLFISNNGTSASYATGSASVVIAEKLFQLGATDSISISFDLSVGGETTWDYLKVFWLPADMVFDPAASASFADKTYGVNVIMNNAESSSNHFLNLISTTQNMSVILPNNHNELRKLVFVWKNDGSGGNGQGAVIDNVIVEGVGEEATCIRPLATSVTATNIATNSATISWTDDDDTHTAWNVYYKADADAEWQVENSSTTSIELSDLSEATMYSVYVTTDCGDEESAPTNTITFLTPCATISDFPYFESFEDGLACWEPTTISGTALWETETSIYTFDMTTYEEVPSSPVDGSLLLYHTWNVDESSIIASPIFDLTSLENPYMKLNVFLGSYATSSESLTIKYRTNNSESWTTLTTISSPSGQWILDSIALPNPTSTYQVAFESMGVNGYGVAIDAITIYDASTEQGGTDPDPEPEPCDAPTALSASNITETTAEITWTGTATTYEFKLNGGEVETLTVATKSLTDLTASTTYTVEVRAICGEQTSEWVSTSFTTLEAQGPAVIAPVVTTLAATDVDHESAVLNGTITVGSEAITAQGFQYKVSTASEWTTVSATGTTISAVVNNLTAETAYTFKAFATTASGTVEGAEMTFTTSAAPIVAPEVTTLAATDVDHESAILNGTITAGSEAITDQGFQYKAQASTEWTTVSATGTTISSVVTGLTAETTYTFKAFATTASGTVEGSEMTFTTSAAPVVIVAGEVTTSPATEVGNTSATLNGALVNAGNSENFTVGFALSTTADFTLEDAGVQNITATLTDNAFSQAVTDLVEGQTYFFRAYITNEAGTAYGAVETFTLSSLADAMANAITATIYPNPAQDNATMEIVGLDQDAKIVVSDLQGRILSQEAISAGTTRYTINVSDLASGVYYIRIVTDKAVSTQKLIVE